MRTSQVTIDEKTIEAIGTLRMAICLVGDETIKKDKTVKVVADFVKKYIAN